MASKFNKNLITTGPDALQKRSAQLEQYVIDELDNAIDKVNSKVKEIKRNIAKRNDLGVDTNDSLKPGRDLDPVAWVRNMKEDKITLLELKVDLKVLKELKEEYFTDDESPKSEE